MRRHLPLYLLLACLSACSSTVAPPVNTPTAPAATPAVSNPTPATPIAPPPLVTVPPPPLAPASTSKPVLNEAQGRALLDRLLPPRISDRQGWNHDIVAAFTALKIPYRADNFCAVAAVIEQESSWQADPTVPNLPSIVWEKIGERANKYLVPLPVVKAALLKTSPNGKSYKARIDSLRTEREMNLLFEDMAAEASKLGLPMNMKNPIRTGGPMQVSVEFAEAHVKIWPYPYQTGNSIRNDVFTRRGGIYFGSAILLQYPAPYQDMRYRFADFNAGRYSSRNAALQAAVSQLTGRKLALDGDLLSYTGKQASGSTYQALLGLRSRLDMSQSEIERDLQQEKNSALAQSELYRKVFALADRQAGKPVPRERMPQIDLHSPKISRKLTTQWFADKVSTRYQACMARQ
ncbi:DUF1615 domain-containing protein [Aquitalea sp. LB_tupeE]|uniref:DUF1615 domain-containing protein n=1 Tax=Aquitalea sp. LB_tupeE TaxID=2748078 RepID=UPI0015C047A2|nr:DUF1615 domain-containing protein [Aquitalea sp. LB_tupeE]NWK77028.1 DUF1615 domain-containing protein [Aquitalea sp. LB_tupeE]